MNNSDDVWRQLEQLLNDGKGPAVFRQRMEAELQEHSRELDERISTVLNPLSAGEVEDFFDRVDTEEQLMYSVKLLRTKELEKLSQTFRKLINVIKIKVRPFEFFDDELFNVHFVFSFEGSKYAYESDFRDTTDENCRYVRIRTATVGEQKGEALFELNKDELEDTYITYLNFVYLCNTMSSLVKKDEETDKALAALRSELSPFASKVRKPGAKTICEFIDRHYPIWMRLVKDETMDFNLKTIKDIREYLEEA